MVSENQYHLWCPLCNNELELIESKSGNFTSPEEEWSSNFYACINCGTTVEYIWNGGGLSPEGSEGIKEVILGEIHEPEEFSDNPDNIKTRIKRASQSDTQLQEQKENCLKRKQLRKVNRDFIQIPKSKLTTKRKDHNAL